MTARWIAVVGCVAFGACATGQAPTGGAWGFCAPPEALPVAWREDPAPARASRVEQIAALLGVSDELRETRTEQPADEPWARTGRVVMLERLEVTRTILEATVAELDCERERAVQIASSLHARKERSTLRFTISSIVMGAATTIASSVLAGANASVWSQEVVALSGGAITAGLAVMPLFDHPTVELQHERNILADVWLGPREPSTIPPVVWAYLTRPAFSNERRTSIRANVVARWKAYELQGVAFDPALLFGTRGRYDAATLDLRAAMLDQIKAEVRLMNQDLATLGATP